MRTRGEPGAELTCADRHCQRVAPVYPSGLQKRAQTGSDVKPQAWNGSTKHVYHKALDWAAETHSALKLGSAATIQIIRSIFFLHLLASDRKYLLHLGCFKMSLSYDPFERHMKGHEDHSRRLTLAEPRRSLHTFLQAEPVVGQYFGGIVG